MVASHRYGQTPAVRGIAAPLGLPWECSANIYYVATYLHHRIHFWLSHAVGSRALERNRTKLKISLQ